MLAQALELIIPVSGTQLRGDLVLPPGSHSLIIFAHGSGSSRKSSRNIAVAQHFQSHQFGTLLFDLLTEREEQEERDTRHLRFDIELLAGRLAAVSQFMRHYQATANMKQGFFGASTGAAAALKASVKPNVSVQAIVSRGGRPDLAGTDLGLVQAPTLFIVGSNDHAVLKLNRDAYQKLSCEKELNIISGATHLFEEPGTLEEVADVATEWFQDYLQT